MNIVRELNNLLQNAGIQIKKYPSLDIRRRMLLLKKSNINKIIDVGANNGLYGLELRKLGYSGEIISFEPLTKAFQELSENAHKDKRWKVKNFAIGSFDGETEINISENSVSSSILEMLPMHYEHEKSAHVINKEIVRMHKMDSIIHDYINDSDKIFLKIDTQGYEKNVLEGAQKSMHYFTGIQVELSLVPLYSGSPLYMEMIALITSLGFSLVSLENGFYEENSGKLLQFDGIFFR